MSQSNAGSNLAAVNSATMGATFPEITLPNGQKVQTGTVGALILNIKSYDQVMSQAKVDLEQKAELEARMSASMPVLKMAQIFDLFTPEEWIQGSSPGRRFVGQLALQQSQS